VAAEASLISKTQKTSNWKGGQSLKVKRKPGGKRRKKVARAITPQDMKVIRTPPKVCRTAARERRKLDAIEIFQSNSGKSHVSTIDGSRENVI